MQRNNSKVQQGMQRIETNVAEKGAATIALDLGDENKHNRKGKEEKKLRSRMNVGIQRGRSIGAEQETFQGSMASKLSSPYANQAKFTRLLRFD